jgi:hypothetical protein
VVEDVTEPELLEAAKYMLNLAKPLPEPAELVEEHA